MFDKLPVSSKTEKILTKSLDEEISVEEANHLMNIKGFDLYPLLATADYLRSEIVGNDVTFINNCNINFTNICTVRCGFCAFGKDADDPDAYILDDEAILTKARGAVEKGAHEFTLMGGVHPDADIEYYEHLLLLLKGEFPEVMIHGFSPTMINDAAAVSGIDMAEACERLKVAGLDTLPGTAAEILTDRSREIICPEKVSVQEWIDAVRTAHEVGIPGSATIMYGHVETLEERVEHIDEKVDTFIENQPVNATDYGAIGTAVTHRVHSYASIHRIPKENRGPLFNDLNSQIKQVTGAGNRSRIKSKDYDAVIRFIDTWEPSTATKTIIEQIPLNLDETA